MKSTSETSELYTSGETTTLERLLNTDEAANLLRVHPKTLQRMARKGQIPAMQIGKLWRFSASALQLWEAHKFAG